MILKKKIIYSTLIFVTYWLIWLFQFYLINPIHNQIQLFHFSTSIASFLFLPHGIRIIAIMLTGLQALPAIFFASITTGFLFLDTKDSFILSILTTFSCFCIIKIFKFEEGYSYENIKIKQIIYIAISLSLLSSLLNSIYKFTISKNIEFHNLIITHTLGDFFGSIVCFYLMGLIYSIRKYTN